MPKIRMEIVIDDDMVAPVSEAIVDAAKTGQIGDGKIFVLSVDQLICMNRRPVQMRYRRKND